VLAILKRKNKLDALLAQTTTSKQDAALFAEMLSLPNNGRRKSAENPPTCASRVTRQRAMTVVGHERQRSPFGLSGCFHHGLRPSLGPVGRTPMRRKRPFEWQ
jgi:hypothetical protein